MDRKEDADEVTELLRQWRGGDESALHRLISIVLRLVHSSRVEWSDHAHFLAVAAKLMRRVLVDWARARRSDKRGGALARVSLEEANAIVGGPNIDILAVDEALSRLAKVEPLQAEVIELRFFSGMTIEETAEGLGLSIDAVKDEWRTARLWLMDAFEVMVRLDVSHRGETRFKAVLPHSKRFA